MGLDDDAACVVTAGWTLAASTGQVDAPQANQADPTHCVVCHLTRAMSGALSSEIAALAAPHVTPARLGLAHDLVGAASLAAPSTRGPPATL